jgi:hypothetical protein
LSHAMSWTTTSAAFTAGAVSFEPAAIPGTPSSPAAPTLVVGPRFTG